MIKILQHIFHMEKEKLKNRKENNNLEDAVEVALENDFIVFNIKRDCSILEYVDSQNKKDTETLVPNNVLFDSSFISKDTIIKKKRIYILSVGHITYAIYSNENRTVINARVQHFGEEVYTDEKIIKIEKKKQEMSITQMKHDSNHSTYFIKCYPHKDSLSPALSEEEAIDIVLEVIDSLGNIPEVEEIVNLEEIYYYYLIQPLTSLCFFGSEHVKIPKKIMNS